MKKYVAIFSLLALNLLSQAQEKPVEMAADKILPLEELIRLSMAHAPGIKVLSTSQDQTREEINITRKKWMQHLSFAAGVNYGNGVVSDYLSSGVGSDNQVTYLTRQNVTYNVGLNIRLPFTEVSSRKNQIKLKKLEIERLEYMKQDEQKQLREEVIKRYNSLMYCLKALELRTEVVEANDMALKVAENYFKAAKMPIEQYRMALDQSYSAKLELEKARNEAWFCYQSLSAIVGESILK